MVTMVMRAECARPGLQFLSVEQYNPLFTMHGTPMPLLHATPTLFGSVNYISPLQTGSPDVAFPSLKMLTHWLFLFGGLITMSGLAIPGEAVDFRWTAYQPLAGLVHSPGVRADPWAVGVVVAGLGKLISLHGDCEAASN